MMCGTRNRRQPPPTRKQKVKRYAVYTGLGIVCAPALVVGGVFAGIYLVSLLSSFLMAKEGRGKGGLF